jgi:hypothetical protein
MNDPVPIPARRSLFAFWTWNRRTWALLVPGVLIVYFLSYAPARHAVSAVRAPAWTHDFILAAYTPVPFLEEIPPIGWTIKAERRILVSLFGDPHKLRLEKKLEQVRQLEQRLEKTRQSP